MQNFEKVAKNNVGELIFIMKNLADVMQRHSEIIYKNSVHIQVDL